MHTRSTPCRRLSLALPLALLLSVPFTTMARAQPPARPLAEGPADPAVSASIVDVNRIDPLTFRAMAARVPDNQALRIDGSLTDPAWDLAPASGNFIQREPHLGAPASERTEFRVLYDDRRIYFGIWAFDSDPNGIQASEMKRDSGLNKGDRIAIVIDTFFDRRNGFYFATNPLGAYKDAQYTDNARVRNNDWNAVWLCRTSRDEQGWYAEIAIPLSQLRFEKSIGESTWGLNVARSIVRRHEDTYWVPYPREQGANGFAYLSNAGVLAGLTDVKAPHRFEFVPFAAPQLGHDFDADTSLTQLDRYGFDARVGLTSSMLADVTYRTDFAQVEADQEVVNVTRFSLFFPEKRQFFTESAGLFNYGKPGVETGLFGPGLLPLFYSRQIGLYQGREVPILAGGRVAGRAGRYSLGFMNIETDQTTFDGANHTLEMPRANYTVMRVKRDVLGRSSVGGIFLNRQGGPGEAYNRTAGADVNLVLGKDARLTGYLAKTFTPGVTKNDWAGAVDFAYLVDKYNYGLTYLDVGRDFNAEMGYIRRTDIRNPQVRGAWTPRPGWRGVRQLSIGGIVDTYATHEGTIESRTADGEFAATFDDTSVLSARVSRDYDLLTELFRLGTGVVEPGGYRWNAARVAYSSNPRLRVTGGGSVETGGYYSGEKTTTSASLSVLPAETLLVEVSYNRNHIELPEAPRYVTNTVSTRLSYSFSPTLFAKGYIQFNDERKLASLNLLLWAIYRPGSDFYIVYNQGWHTDLPGPRANQVRDRSLAVKLTYWFSR